MKKQLTLASLAILLFNFAIAQELSKEDKKRLKEEIKSYSKDLAGYKAKMDDIRITLDSNDAEIKRLKDDLAYGSTVQAELDNKLTDYSKELQRCNDSLTVLNANSEPGGDFTVYEENSGGSVSSGAGTGGTSAGKSKSRANNSAKKGTVFKVQFGLYKDFSIVKYFEQPRYIGYEEENGMNRYVISDFEEEEIAMKFVQDVRKMGIRDAFVAKYIDGQRVYEWSKNPKYKGKPVPSSLEEALEMDKKGKKGKKNN